MEINVTLNLSDVKSSQATLNKLQAMLTALVLEGNDDEQGELVEIVQTDDASLKEPQAEPNKEDFSFMGEKARSVFGELAALIDANGEATLRQVANNLSMELTSVRGNLMNGNRTLRASKRKVPFERQWSINMNCVVYRRVK